MVGWHLLLETAPTLSAHYLKPLADGRCDDRMCATNPSAVRAPCSVDGISNALRTNPCAQDPFVLYVSARPCRSGLRMGTHPCGHVIASVRLHECGMEGDSIRRVLACNAFVGKKASTVDLEPLEPCRASAWVSAHAYKRETRQILGHPRLPLVHPPSLTHHTL